MPLMSKPSAEAKIAIVFVTLGALTIVWSGVWLVYQNNHTSETPPWEQYVSYGCLLSGVVVTAIGFALGRIARAARQAEMPPSEITQAEGQISHEAASRAPIVTPLANGAAAVTGANGTAVPANPAAPVARAVPGNSGNQPNPAAHSAPAATI